MAPSARAAWPLATGAPTAAAAAAGGPASGPALAPSAALEFQVLAERRTSRPNPLRGLQDWNGGWNPFSKDYWASLIWSGVPAALTGLAWLLLGIVGGVTMVCMCICCRPKWRAWRSREIPSHGRLDVVTIILGVCAASLCIAGFVYLCRGQVQFWHRVMDDVDFVYDATTRVTGVVSTVASAMQRIGEVNILGFRVPGHEKILEISSKAQEASTKAETIVTNTQEKANYYTRVTIIVAVTLSAVLLLLALAVLAFAYWQLALLFTLAIALLWFLCFFSLSMLTVWSNAYNFMGDTYAALEQIQANPLAPSVMTDVIPCMNNTLLNITATAARRAIYESINLLNDKWQGLDIPPLVTTLLRAGGSRLFNITNLCNPVGGPPDYLPTGCLPGVPSLEEVAQSIRDRTCDRNARLCSVVNSTVVKVEVVMLLAGVALDHFLPQFRPIASCQYLADIAGVLIRFGKEYYFDIYEAWLGYLLLCIGAMTLALLLTVYILFGTSNFSKKRKKDGLENGKLDGDDVRPEDEEAGDEQEVQLAQPLTAEKMQLEGAIIDSSEVDNKDYQPKL